MDQVPQIPQSRIFTLLALIIVVVFGQVIAFEFVNIDDPVYINNFMVVKGLTLEGQAWAFANIHTNFSTTLNWVSHMLDVELFGLNPAGHHLTNLLLHLLNTFLFFIILEKITRDRWKSAMAAVLFAIHPLRVETVAWVADRKDLLAMLFSLLTIGAYWKYAVQRRPMWYGVTAVCFVLALLAKPVMVILPFVLLLIDCWPLHRLESSSPFQWAQVKPLFLEKVPLLGLSGLFSWIAYNGQAVRNVMVSETALPWLDRWLNVPINYMRYLGKIFWPADLAVFYPLSYQTPAVWKIVGSLLLLIGVTVWAVRLFRNAPYLLIGWLWFLGSLVPVLGFVKAGFQEIADRYTYFPLIGIFLMAVWGLAEVVKRWKIPIKAIRLSSAVLAAVLMLVSWNQTRVWQNSVTLFQHTVDHTERNDFAHNNLGFALMRRGEMEASIVHFKKALEISPHHTFANLNLAKAYRNLDRPKEAIFAYNEILKMQPGHVVVHFELGKLYHKVGEGPRAIHHARIAHALLIRNYGPEFDKTREAEENLKHYYQVYNLKP
jgi:tetratricopeptide (TPR) repeat protein